MTIVDLATQKQWMNEATTANDALVQAALTAAEQAVNNACGRKFVVASASSARTYKGNGSEVLRIHDCTAVTGVTFNGSTIDSSTYVLEPLNGLSWAGESRPYDQIRRPYVGWYSYSLTLYYSVTATWGWPAIPAPIIEAVKVVAKDIYTNRDMKHSGVVDFASGAVAYVGQSKDVQRLIKDYRRVEAFGGIA